MMDRQKFLKKNRNGRLFQKEGNTDMAHHGDVVRRDIGLLVLRLRRIVPGARSGELLIHSSCINKTRTL